jgi:hypothetical protein
VEGEVEVTVKVRGVKNPDAAVIPLISMIKRALFHVDGKPGEFGAEIRASGPGRSEVLTLDMASGEWRRERDSNPRGG